MFDGNGISSQVIAFRLGLIPGLLIMFLQGKLITFVKHSEMPSLKIYFLGMTSLGALFASYNWQSYNNDPGKCLNRKLMT